MTITTVTSRELNQDIGSAKRAAKSGPESSFPDTQTFRPTQHWACPCQPALVVKEHLRHFRQAPRLHCATCTPWRKRLRVAARHRFRLPAPAGLWVVQQDEVEVVAHHGEGVQRDGKQRRQAKRPLRHPRLAMGVVLPAALVSPEQPLAPDAARDHVVRKRPFRVQQPMPRMCCHGRSIQAWSAGPV